MSEQRAIHWINFLLLFMVFMVSCAMLPKNSDDTFKPYIHSFEQEFNTKVNIAVTFNNLPADIAGVCFTYGFGREVQIDLPYWTTLTETSKEALVYHELGHCILNLPHDSRRMPDKCPSSIMYPSMFSDDCYERHRDMYIKIMKNKGKIK